MLMILQTIVPATLFMSPTDFQHGTNRTVVKTLDDKLQAKDQTVSIGDLFTVF